METLLKPSAVADRYGWTAGHLANLRSKGLGGPPYVKLGRKVLYRATDVEAWEKQMLVATGRAA